MPKEPGEYRVMSESVRTDPSEVDIRLGKAFVIVFEEVFKAPRRRRVHRDPDMNNPGYNTGSRDLVAPQLTVV